MDSTFHPQSIEQHWYQEWEKRGYFAPSGTGDPFSIMIPPPNITGRLHMGHALQYSIMDALIRYRRMQGRNTLWQVGTDHSGIATQMVVERNLATEGEPDRRALGREKFVAKVWQWKEESGGEIIQQMRRLGNSVDWENERFTMDEDFSNSVQEAFVRLYEEGLIYRGKRLVNWDPKLLTAISDLEVENRETSGKMWHIRYPLADGKTTASGDRFIVVATTRPETLLGDTGVAVNPEDPRYRDLIGSQVILPLVNRPVGIVGDDHAQMDKGTGCVKITPAHDFNDYAVGQRHNLPMINILTKSASIRQSAECLNSDGSDNNDIDALIPQKYRGLNRFEVRRQIIADLEESGALHAIEDNDMTVPFGDRSGVAIEPMLTDQWYVDAKKLAVPAVAAVEKGRIKFVPQQYENMYFAWLRNVQDWCISRQLWWGHRIPAWYDDNGHVFVGNSETHVREKYQLGMRPLHQDPDVLDTWFSSALWSFATLGWPKQTNRLALFHPTSVLVTGFDIIFFWVARMVMLSMHFLRDDDGQPQVPFETVYVHGLIRDEQGQKMSKSKGNVIDPLDMIDGISLEDLQAKRTANMMQPQFAKKIAARTKKQFPQGIEAYGADALRFTLCALASTGRDINWDMKRLEGYRNFCNKLWNAARYVLLHTEGCDCNGDTDGYELSLADQWIVSRLQAAQTDVEHALNNYRFDLASQALYDFVWNEYCDWYLELSKPVLWDENGRQTLKTGTRRTLVRVLEAILRLAHPMLPFITEEIWQSIAPLANIDGDTIMQRPYPKADPALINLEAESDIEWLKSVIVGIRSLRAQMNISPAKLLSVVLEKGGAEDHRRLQQNNQFLCKLAHLSEINWAAEGEEVPVSMTAIAGDLEILVPLAGHVDIEDERQRLSREVNKLHTEIDKLEAKLSNASFVNKAPSHIVDKERQKLEELRTADQILRDRLAAVSRIESN